MHRRSFVKNAGLLAAISAAGYDAFATTARQDEKIIRVTKTNADFEREKLLRPFGFKGGYLTECWQTASALQSASGIEKIGLATQNVLYSDARLFASRSEAGGNALMFTLVNEALAMIKETPFTTPVELFSKLLPRLTATGNRLADAALNINFIYNALVSVDNAAWLLYAAENGYKNFDEMIPAAYRPTLSHHNDRIAIMYQVPYGMPIEELKAAATRGYFVIKIKTGFPGSQETMLAADMERLTQVHQALRDIRTTQTKNGKLIYTMDANARYEKKATLMRYLDHARNIGALDQVLLYEEPFVETNDEDVRDTGIIIAGDESVHDEEGARRRLAQGYSAIVLKGIAKTLSLSMRIAKVAFEKNIPCLCADLTVNSILIDWHKNLAGRLAPFPGINMGMMETNGNIHYRNWQNMVSYNPANGASWTKAQNGVFELGRDFYDKSGGIFEPSAHYTAMFQPPVN